jgi:hypothetical protein
MRGGDETAEVRVPLRCLHEHGHVGAVGERQLGTGDRTDTEVLRGVRELERPVDAVVVGQRERGILELGCAEGELLRVRRAVEERVRGMRVQLDVGHRHTRV